MSAATLKDRIAGAELAAETEESPIAGLFRPHEKLEAAAPTPQEQKQTGSVRVGTSEFRDIPADQMEEMEQPFQINDNYIQELEESITERGVIQRIIVRPHPSKPGMYQIIDGRHRRRAAMRVGYTLLPSEIRQLDDDQAVLTVIETTLRQRPKLLPSEKAKAYKIRLEALSHQGKRTLSQSATKSDTAAEIGKEIGESRDQIFRYIRLTYLIPELLDAVDTEKLGFGVGVTLSYIGQTNQESIYDYFVANNITISGTLAETLRALDEKQVGFTPDKLREVTAPAVAPKKLRKISVPMKSLRKYFREEATEKEIQEEIVELVKANAEGRLPLKWYPGWRAPEHPMTAVAKFEAGGAGTMQRLVAWDGESWRFPGEGGAPIDATCIGWWPVPAE